MRIFIIRTNNKKVKQWIWLISPHFPSSPFLPLLFSPSCPFFLLSSFSLVPSISVWIKRGRKWIYIFISQLLRDRHCKSIKAVDKGDMEEDPGMFQELKVGQYNQWIWEWRWKQKWGRCSIRETQREQVSNLLRCLKWQDTEGTHKIVRFWALLIFKNLVKNLTYPSENYLVHLSYTAKKRLLSLLRTTYTLSFMTFVAGTRVLDFTVCDVCFDIVLISQLVSFQISAIYCLLPPLKVVRRIQGTANRCGADTFV